MPIPFDSDPLSLQNDSDPFGLTPLALARRISEIQITLTLSALAEGGVIVGVITSIAAEFEKIPH